MEKMIRNSLLALVCISVGLLQGCTNGKTAERTHKKKDVIQNEQPAQVPALQQCIRMPTL